MVYGPETSDEMANARIYYAPTKPQNIVVGGEIPADMLEAARRENQLRREHSETLDLSKDDLEWLNDNGRMHEDGH